MPSRIQLAIRKTAAMERLNTGLTALTARLGIEVDPVGGAPVKDPDLAAVIQIEEMADAVDAISDAIPAKPAAKAKA